MWTRRNTIILDELTVFTKQSFQIFKSASVNEPYTFQITYATIDTDWISTAVQHWHRSIKWISLRICSQFCYQYQSEAADTFKISWNEIPMLVTHFSVTSTNSITWLWLPVSLEYLLLIFSTHLGFENEACFQLQSLIITVLRHSRTFLLSNGQTGATPTDEKQIKSSSGIIYTNYNNNDTMPKPEETMWLTNWNGMTSFKLTMRRRQMIKR